MHHIHITCWGITGIGIPVITITIALARIVDRPLALYLPHPVKLNAPPVCLSSSIRSIQVNHVY